MLIQNFLAHPVSSCTSSLHFWFLIRFISRLHASMCVYMPYSKHKNIKLFGWCPLDIQRSMNVARNFNHIFWKQLSRRWRPDGRRLDEPNDYKHRFWWDYTNTSALARGPVRVIKHIEINFLIWIGKIILWLFRLW